MNTEPLQQKNFIDDAGMPAGGIHVSPGCTIVWQDGPLGRHTSDCALHGALVGSHTPCDCGGRSEPNGAFVENVIRAAVVRIRWYQTVCDGRFACPENGQALDHLNLALSILNNRTIRREKAGIEGTHAES